MNRKDLAELMVTQAVGCHNFDLTDSELMENLLEYAYQMLSEYSNHTLHHLTWVETKQIIISFCKLALEMEGETS